MIVQTQGDYKEFMRGNIKAIEAIIDRMVGDELNWAKIADIKELLNRAAMLTNDLIETNTIK